MQSAIGPRRIEFEGGGVRYLALDPFETAVLRALVAHKAAFVVIGGSAVHLHGYTDRKRKDLDLLTNQQSADNCERIEAALADVSRQFGPHAFVPMMAGTLTYKGVYIDVLARMHGLYGENPFTVAQQVECEAGLVPVLSLRHLISSKRAMWRPQDVEDLSALTACPISGGRCSRCGAGRGEHDAWQPLPAAATGCEFR